MSSANLDIQVKHGPPTGPRVTMASLMHLPESNRLHLGTEERHKVNGVMRDWIVTAVLESALL